MLKSILTIIYMSLFLMSQSCTSLNSNTSEIKYPKLKNNRYISSQTYFSINIPTIMNSNNVIISEYGLGLDSNRVVVNFDPLLPDRAVFTVQIADKVLYEEVSSLGSVDIFRTGSNNSIRDDFAKYFFGKIFRSLKEYKFKQLVLNHFDFNGSDVTYAVYKDLSINTTSDINYIPPDFYYIFYLTEMDNKGVLVWLQIPITSKELDGRTEYNLIHRKWNIQNEFFTSLKIFEPVFSDDSDLSYE